MQNADEIDGKSASLKWPIVFALGVLVLWAASGLLIHKFSDSPGTFGDTFGAINALFSGFAFAGVIYAILLQRVELKLQRNELQLTRAELAGQKEQLRAQNDTLRQQNFESTFFQLLRLHNDIVSSIDLRGSDGGAVTQSGRDCFRMFYDRFKKRWGKAEPDDQGNSAADRLDRTYLATYAAIEADVGHYFRSLYNIVKFVDGSSMENKRLYTNLIRAQLSTYELTLLFYNCLSSMGSEKFKPLVERYALLKMVPRKQLISESHLTLYASTAYEKT